MKKVYLDFNASTPIAPEVAETMRPYLVEHYGNPSSRHWAGAPAREAVETARGQVADLLGCSAEEIVFTSGGTESNNHAIKGVYFALRERGNHIITTKIEHPATIQPCRFLEKLGAEVTYLPVDRTGTVNPDDVQGAINGRTILVTVMHANNEVGTIQPIAEIAEITRDRGIAFHTDAAQSVGKVPTRVDELGVDLLSVAGHKVYAPKGVGALYIRNGVRIEPCLHGAGHENGRRAGTENVLLNVGLGAACELAKHWVGMPAVRDLRDRFWQMLRDAIGDGVVLNGHPDDRLPNTLNVSFVGRVGSDVLSRLEGVAASTGSACHEGTVTLSPVLEAMGISPEVGMGAVRFSLGRTTTPAEIEYVAERVKETVVRTDIKRTSQKRLSDMTDQEIKAAVADRYGQVASTPGAKFNFPVGRKFAESVGYGTKLLDSLPASMWESFTGAGNPQPHVDPRPAETVLDLGCGAGLDLYLYAKAVGPQGKAYGLDLSEAMIAKARRNMEATAVENVEFLCGPADAIPLPDASVDLVTGNGIYSLSPDKGAVMREVARVLKPGGRTVVAEIALKAELPKEIRKDINDWFRCIGGALPEPDFLSQLSTAGLADARILWKGRNARTGHPLSVCAVFRAEKKEAPGRES